MTNHDDMSTSYDGGAGLVPLKTYAQRRGVALRTVQRWIAAEELPGAQQDDRGQWWVPLAADRVPAGGPVQSPMGPGPSSPTRAVERAARTAPASPLGTSGTLGDAAASLGVSPIGLRKLYADMAANPGLPFYVGRYGAHGALRVVVPPR